ncbi:hypothetical protein I6N95_08155 [Vagococcus sp. BWB3-3]|uniref:Uncharacterized protein n=1 Tax=Vagococcus allomyrinae TaxID=2794353 RepID=A0A940PDT6_9ENTE|nr:hypothetical protein [Vagococcus allomyrinae]MBP1040973.1 hypothetical protein [Vagococcus allomyrinae]
MTGKITVKASELSSITSELESVISELESSHEALKKILANEYYLEGQAKGLVGMFAVTSVRLNELIAHYTRLKEYVSFAGETFVEVDSSISQTIQTNK